MRDLFCELWKEFLVENKRNRMFQFEVIEGFCSRNNLYGIDGINGLLGYVKRLVSEGTNNNEKPLMKSFGELSFSIWALEKLNRIDIPDKIANNFAVGGDFGDTEAYLTETGGNFFRNFELEMVIALRLLENNINFRVGEASEPDYLIEDRFDFSIEVKAPSSKLALLQNMLKAVKQIERSDKKGVILLTLDHMVVNNYVDNAMDELPIIIQEVIAAALPEGDEFNTIGVIIDWVKWDENEQHLSTVMPIMLKEKNNAENEEITRMVWQAMSVDDISSFPIKLVCAQNSFPYLDKPVEEINPTIDGKKFYTAIWGDK